jgi:hypothetical protein
MDGALIKAEPPVIVRVPGATKELVSSMRLGCKRRHSASNDMFLASFGALPSKTILPLVGYAWVGELAVGFSDDL